MKPQIIAEEIIKGVEFCDLNLGEMLIKKWGDEVWVFKKHPDGQWVSMRPATKADFGLLGFIAIGIEYQRLEENRNENE